ncbi:MAG: hypothetical protein MUE41_05480 [Gemmatimonadaceae bacterium]|jgi:hypothetical protein|nr:hypothetical protein [Gemmatimonadaceae bacterium]
MSPIRATALVALLILAINLPFGVWRAGLRKMSVPWFVAVHVPVLLAMGARWVLGVPFRWGAVPFYVVAFIAGQWAGMRIARARRGRPAHDAALSPAR